MSETQEAKKLQWVKGDKLGKVETVVDETSEWINFESGSRINSSLLKEFMIDVTDTEFLVDTEITQKKPQVNTSVPNDQNHEVKVENPIMSLFKTMENTDQHNLSINIPIDIPTHDIFKILKGTFGKDKVESTFEDYINDQLNESELKNAISESVGNLIKSFTEPSK